MKNNITASLFVFLLFFTVTFCFAGKTVTATGTAEGQPDKAGEQALADALRNAVREGAGVDVMSETKVQNFQMEYDRVMTSSFGYIEDYKILEQKYDKDKELYTVKVEANVGKSSPGMDNIMALRTLVKRMESPRVTVICNEKISGTDGEEHTLVSGMLEEMAQKSGFELYSQSAIDTQNSKSASRAEILGDTVDAKVRKAGITSSSDFNIVADIKGSVGKLREPFPDVKVRDVALSADLRAVWTDTGEVIATLSVPTSSFKGEKNMSLPYEMPDQLVSYYLEKVLSGKEKDAKDSLLYRFFNRIISKWITELDLGAKIKLEFKQIDKKTLDVLIDRLREEKAISYVWKREFDRRLFSIVEIETRLTSSEIEDIVLKIIEKADGKKYEIDQATKKSLRFIPES